VTSFPFVIINIFKKDIHFASVAAEFHRIKKKSFFLFHLNTFLDSLLCPQPPGFLLLPPAAGKTERN
jgi:hypothetical protein